MSISCLAVTGHSDLPETHLFVGLFRAGIQLEVMCPSDAPNRHFLVEAGVPVFDLSLKGRFDKNGVAAIKERLDARQVDIVHAFNNKTVSNSLRATRGYSCKFIAYRGIEANVSYYDPMSWMTYLHPRVDVIVCVADAIRKYFWNMRFLGLPFPVKKAQTIYKGHDETWYDSPAADLTSFGVPKNSLVVGCTMNDRPRKGLKYLIDAANLLPEELPIHFVLIGHVKSEKLLKAIAESRWANKMHLLGYQKNAAAIIKSCDICILPATKREGLPKGIIEGMIQKVAPIVTDSGGSPELIEHGKSGLIVRSKSAEGIANAIQKLCDNAELLAAIKENARIRVSEKFNNKSTIQEHLKLYQKIS